MIDYGAVPYTNPFGVLFSIRYGRRQEHKMNGIRKQDDRFLPDHPSLLVSHVVNLIKYYLASWRETFRQK